MPKGKVFISVEDENHQELWSMSCGIESTSPNYVTLQTIIRDILEDYHEGNIKNTDNVNLILCDCHFCNHEES